MVGRRGFFAGAAALALSGCGRTATDDEPGGAPQSRAATSTQGDIELLQAALGIELAQRSGVDREHERRLLSALEDLGAGAKPAPGLGEPQESAAGEAQAIAFYLDMLPKLHDAKLRRLIASILVVEGEQLAVLRMRDGQDPAPEPFEYGTIR